jgi:hypothetical protein
MSKKEQIREIAIGITKELTKQGKLLEGGWAAFEAQVMPPNAPEYQVQDMRIAFFAGAEHLFSSIMSSLDSDREPTEADEKRMSLIYDELQKFRAEMVLLVASKDKKGNA